MAPEPGIFYRRNLPHWQPRGAVIFFTWRLDSSLPQEVLSRLAAERCRLDHDALCQDESERDRAIRHDKILFVLYDDALDRSADGPLWLKDIRLAQIVIDALFYQNEKLYDLFAFVVMTNHVHVLLRPLVVPTFQSATYTPISRITQSLKGFTAHECNRILDRTGQPFWQHESYDHWVRDERELSRIVTYIEFNPVKAHLVEQPEDWRWSSAWERKAGRLTIPTL
jgi:putative transposase